MPAPQCLPPAERRRTARACGSRSPRDSRRRRTPARMRRGCRRCSAPPAATARTATRSARRSPPASGSISPTRFHNSVHNAAAGYWGIATGATAAANALCAYDASFGAGLLEALTQVHTSRSGRSSWSPTMRSYPEPMRGDAADPGRVRASRWSSRRRPARSAPRAPRGYASPKRRRDAAARAAARGAARAACRRRAACRCCARLARAGDAPVVLEYLEPRQLCRRGERMPLDRQWIEQHIPHKGRMCLLDEVLAWDAAAHPLPQRDATARATTRCAPTGASGRPAASSTPPRRWPCTAR